MSKKNMLITLSVLSFLIIASGISFGVYSFLHNIQFMVLNTSVPGYIFGLVAAFLGIRYFRSLLKLRNRISDPGMMFSWNNFRSNSSIK